MENAESLRGCGREKSVQYKIVIFMLRIMMDYWVERGFIFTGARLSFITNYSLFNFLKVLWIFLYFICLEFSKFFTQDKVPIHFKGHGRTIIAGQFPKPYSSKDLS